MSNNGLTLGDAELIAAFLDRRLSERERRDFIERLDREETLYEVFVETVRYREEKRDEGASVVEHPSGRGRKSWAIPSAVAAVLALAVFGPIFVRDSDLMTGAGFARALAEDERLDGILDDDWMEQGWRRTRGLKPSALSEVDSAFRVGVHSVDLEVALRLGRRDDAETLLRMIDFELSGIDLSDQLRLSYTDIRGFLEEDLPLEKALERTLTTEPLASDLLDIGQGYAFGKWAEAGKLAAQVGNEDLLRSRTFRKMLRQLRENEWTVLVDGQLALIESIVDDRNAELDLAVLERAFTTVINES